MFVRMLLKNLNQGKPRIWLWSMVSFLLFSLILISLSSKVWAIVATAGDEQIQVAWTAPTQNEDGSPLTDLAGYNIYRGIAKEEQPDKLNQEPVTACNYVDKGLINGHTYFYIVKAIDASGNESLASKMIFATPTILPPAGFQAVGDDGKIKLFWEKNENPSVTGYYLHRTLTPGRGYQKITDLPLENTYFEDLDVHNGVNYYYTIKSKSEDGLESPYSEEQAATPIPTIPVEPSSLSAKYEPGKVTLTWQANPDDKTSVVYRVYRRSGLGVTTFEKLAEKTVEDFKLNETSLDTKTTYYSYQDSSIEENTSYLYSVVGVSANGVESLFPLEVSCYTKTLFIASVTDDTEGKPKKAGDHISVILRGEPGCKSSFSIQDLVENQPMEETQPGSGVYYGEYLVQGGRNIAEAALIAYLTDLNGHKTPKEAARKISIKNDPPPPLQNFSGQIVSNRWPELRWVLPSADTFAYIELYRSLSQNNLETNPETTIKINKDTLTYLDKNTNLVTYVDQKADLGGFYYYAARTVDGAGNHSPLTAVVPIDLAKVGDGPSVESVTDNTLGLPAKTGQVITISVLGERGCQASFSIDKIIEGCSLTEIRPRLYQGQYTVKNTDQTDGTFVVAKLMDLSNRETAAQGEKPLRLNITSNDSTPPVIKSLEHNENSQTGLTGKFVANDQLLVTLYGEPGGLAHFSLGSEGRKIALSETPTPGEYQASYTIIMGDDGEEITIYGYLSDQAGNISFMACSEPISIDTRSIITVRPDDRELLADRKSNTKVTIKVEDINGRPLRDHHFALTLSTTGEYTDVVEGGDFGRGTDGLFAIDFDGVTDSMGQVEATFTTGLAAKTALIIAKDLDTGHVGVDYLSTYIEGHIDLTLEAPKLQRSIDPGPGDAAKAVLTIDPGKITADGRSQARLMVQLYDRDGKPVTKPYEVIFSLSTAEGEIIDGRTTTNSQGRAYAHYRAGKRIGTITISALAKRAKDPDQAPLVIAEAPIILMSDAPAKLMIKADHSNLPVGRGQSTSLSFMVTDINDNPNPQATIQLSLKNSEGKNSNNGVLSGTYLTTNRDGQSECNYTAGNDPGVVQVYAKVSSRIPTTEELAQARGTIFVPLWIRGTEDDLSSIWLDEVMDREIGIIQEWRKNEDDEVQQGEPLVAISTEEYGLMWIRSPYTGKLVDIKSIAGEKVKVGQTIGLLIPERD